MEASTEEKGSPGKVWRMVLLFVLLALMAGQEILEWGSPPTRTAGFIMVIAATISLVKGDFR